MMLQNKGKDAWSEADARWRAPLSLTGMNVLQPRREAKALRDVLSIFVKLHRLDLITTAMSPSQALRGSQQVVMYWTVTRTSATTTIQDDQKG